MSRIIKSRHIYQHVHRSEYQIIFFEDPGNFLNECLEYMIRKLYKKYKNVRCYRVEFLEFIDEFKKYKFNFRPNDVLSLGCGKILNFVKDPTNKILENLFRECDFVNKLSKEIRQSYSNHPPDNMYDFLLITVKKSDSCSNRSSKEKETSRRASKLNVDHRIPLSSSELSNIYSRYSQNSHTSSKFSQNFQKSSILSQNCYPSSCSYYDDNRISDVRKRTISQSDSNYGNVYEQLDIIQLENFKKQKLIEEQSVASKYNQIYGDNRLQSCVPLTMNPPLPYPNVANTFEYMKNTSLTQMPQFYSQESMRPGSSNMDYIKSRQ